MVSSLLEKDILLPTPCLDKGPSLCGLPAEILEDIVDYALDCPGRAIRHAYSDITLPLLLSNPVLRTSKQLRQHALDILNKRCLWIRFTLIARSWWLIHKFRTVYRPIVPPLYGPHYSLLESDTLRTLDVICSDHKVAVDWNTHYNDGRFCLVLPFSPSNWFMFIDMLGVTLTKSDGSVLCHLAFRCESRHLMVRWLIDHYIAPSLRYFMPPILKRFVTEGTGLNKVGIEENLTMVRGYPIYRNEIHVQFLKDALFEDPKLRAAYYKHLIYIERLQGLLRHVTLLRESGRSVHAAWASLTVASLREDRDHVLGYSDRLREQIFRVRDREIAEKIHAIINEAYKLIQDIMFEVACSLYLIYRVEGAHWIQRNYDRLAYACGWFDRDEEIAPIILRHHELARAELASAIVRTIMAGAFRMGRPSLARNLRGDAAASEYIVSRIWPDMPELEYLQHLKHDHEDIVVPEESNSAVAYTEVHQAGGTNYLWRGRADVLFVSGEGAALSDLPKLRPRLSDGVDSIEEYCSDSCRCVVY